MAHPNLPDNMSASAKTPSNLNLLSSCVKVEQVLCENTPISHRSIAFDALGLQDLLLFDALGSVLDTAC